MKQLNNFKPTASQLQAIDLLKTSGADRFLARGGRRSGKSVAWSFAVAGRALMYPRSKHGVFRNTLNTCRQLLFQGTFIEVMDLAWPGYLERDDVTINKQDSTITFHNGSVIYFRGLDENRTSRLRGSEFATIWLNECNEVRDYESITVLESSLNHSTPMLNEDGSPVLRDGKPLMIKPKLLFDCNPQLNSDWDALAFKFLKNPASGLPHKRPDRWREIKMDPEGNLENQAAGYLEGLYDSFDGMPGAMSTFILGEWRDDNPNALFHPNKIKREIIDRNEIVRIVVALDPTTTGHDKSDEAGIVVAGRLKDGRAVVLADYSVRGVPDVWAAATVQAYDDWEADSIVYEKNQGGLMVESTLQGIRRNLPCVAVHASKGKVSRAEPVSIQYTKGRVIHDGNETDKLKTLEQQMFDFEAVVDRKGSSPDRVDALVYAITAILDLNGDQPNTGKMFKIATNLW
ncbi:phage terminase large subunit [Sphingomonas sp. Leaf34]|uniref:phage terminase large subunit n=1 Tax=Sphingomonas sp. Leaf34 TaxID=1736216 RepID=UPI0009E93DB6|nr:phage terminase large subunit [Sphingomonas sp. Leaf34]